RNIFRKQITNLQDDNQHINWEEVVEVFLCICSGGHTVLISLLSINAITKAIRISALEISARRMHVHLFRALLVQFLVPLFFSLLPMTLIFLVPATGISFGEFGNIFGLCVSVFPALDLLFVILAYGRFRSTLSNWVRVIFGNPEKPSENIAFAQSIVHHSM
ncbi:hypothetical protein PMAYCL1PPCAC_22226, partial [Pristionchus mayeri]